MLVTIDLLLATQKALHVSHTDSFHSRLPAWIGRAKILEAGLETLKPHFVDKIACAAESDESYCVIGSAATHLKEGH